MMKFDVEVVKKCLMRHKEVFTVRAYRSYDRFRVVDVDGVDYLCERVKKVDEVQDLNAFVRLSGFRDVNDWWKKIKAFKAVGGYLYKVSLL